ncbi:acetyl-CoA carboxylase biotin carboxyl carrier protein [Glaciihabitans tibetensis]|uniref:Biotin carboxyl carrier protein of acetyl-CoA carboxylase n=1 Tax=Glaciihabitans tibetensis TaxID=1266600 RepID=A0A2T0VKB4_9MICO|nr:biotin/lipoyl-containing protein [Glaciihabitans tibetensis]PRY70565.1 acetyl-CoA carboxylase biotin carboxyl carrier protein [Glaciihabitans tibetensis]
MTLDDSTASTNRDVPQPAAILPSANPESMLELRQEVAELARTLPGDVRRLRVRGGDREIEVEWSVQVGTGEPLLDRRRPAHAGETAPLTAAAPPPIHDDITIAVRAPLVGCYFAAPSPGAEPFVQVGDAVEAGTTVAIIEAMKLMNAIVAGESGVISEVLVSDGESVEYDQVLLRLHPKEQAA